METLSITNLEQSRTLVSNGMDSFTSDSSVFVHLKKRNGTIEVEEKVFLNQSLPKNKGENENVAAAWSLGKLIDILPTEIWSSFDINNIEQPEGSIRYILNMGKDWVTYVAMDGRRRYLTKGDNLLDAVVKIVVQLLIDKELEEEPVI